MISVRLLTPEEVAELLTAHGYSEVAVSIPDHACWKAPCGTHLLVPLIGPDRMAVHYWLEEQMGLLAKGERRLN